jgi:hypothetical protein
MLFKATIHVEHKRLLFITVADITFIWVTIYWKIMNNELGRELKEAVVA